MVKRKGLDYISRRCSLLDKRNLLQVEMSRKCSKDICCGCLKLTTKGWKLGWQLDTVVTATLWDPGHSLSNELLK
jgi:hypothetical protein